MAQSKKQKKLKHNNTLWRKNSEVARAKSIQIGTSNLGVFSSKRDQQSRSSLLKTWIYTYVSKRTHLAESGQNSVTLSNNSKVIVAPCREAEQIEKKQAHKTYIVAHSRNTHKKNEITMALIEEKTPRLLAPNLFRLAPATSEFFTQSMKLYIA